MKTRMFAIAALLSIAVSFGTLLVGVESSPAGVPGCCSCLCGGPTGFQTCTDAGFGIDGCMANCTNMECGFNFFVNNTACSDPTLAETCNAVAGGTMAPAASPIGLTALGAVLAGLGAFYLRRRRSA